MKKASLLKPILGFAALFACYHAAEYQVLYQKSPPGFLLLSAVFFFVAWVVANLQGDKGLSAFGMVFHKQTIPFLAAGLAIGAAVNAAAFFTCLYLDIEVVSFVPPEPAFISQAALLISGTFFSSLTEDVLTRGYVYRHLKKKVSLFTLVIISSLIYVLNHIHRLDEPVYLLYLFVIGVQLMIPLLFTKSIWCTLGVHWAGNIVYHITNTVMHTGSGKNGFPALWIFIFFMILLIPVNYFASKRLFKTMTKRAPVEIDRYSSAGIRHSSTLA